MGRAKKLKQLRKAAQTLPPDYERRMMRLSGEEVIASGITEAANGAKINPKLDYKGEGTTEVNHYRKMKKMLKPGAWADLIGYAEEVKQKDLLRKKLLDDKRNPDPETQAQA